MLGSDLVPHIVFTPAIQAGSLDHRLIVPLSWMASMTMVTQEEISAVSVGSRCFGCKDGGYARDDLVD